MIACLVLIQLPSVAKFPEDFLGEWKGTMVWTKTKDQSSQKVPMTLRISKTKDPKVLDYFLGYGENQEDSRPYKLKQSEPNSNEWILDEGGGIEIKEFWVNYSLTSVFSVSNVSLHGSLKRVGKKLVSEIVTFEIPTAPTGQGVTSSRILSIQRAELSKR
jgi:hypothetical protein